MHPYEPFIHLVAKPARYLGGEYNSVRKDFEEVDCRFCLCFPDIYDIGMSHLGTKILYSIVNKTPDLAMERCFTPWVDMERELRERELPLLSLENARPLSDFDVVGFSLQYEMTFTNVLTMLDLGGIPLRNKDRTLEHPIVIAGGPTATHPEPIAPFIDAFLVGDAEERLPRLLRHIKELRADPTRSRLDILAEVAAEGGVYCPDLYQRALDPITDMVVVSGPRQDLGSGASPVPDVVERAFVDDISRFRFPDDSPVAVAEAIFDRMSVEVARGCTEGCRFCQAGMIYRPVRERDPDEIIETVLSALDKGGYDEAAITSLSTADYSCISPLIKRLMEKLRTRRASLGISSLRAYGLSEEALDEIASVKATGLTFAPEAGTQRMRDVINKNVTEDDIFETCHRVFSRGWKRMKLYFILGLPTEDDEDLLGIAKMGRQALRIGREYEKNVAVTVSVSSHVPKPHTPFQWAAMDPLEEIARKQGLLRRVAHKWGLGFRQHEMHVSHLEGIIARGDIRVGELIEKAWRGGARFDGWDDQLQWDAWQAALREWETEEGLSRQIFLDTVPVDGRLPWDHIDVGLEDGFLLREYQKALKSRLSPPCGKPFRAKVHHTNVAEHEADERRLICYDCGIACDMSKMRTDRRTFLERLGALEPAPASPSGPTRTQTAAQRHKAGLSPHDFVQGEKVRYRLRYTKLGPVSLQGHLDMVRILPRMLVRAGHMPFYSRGFSPKPSLSFGPALGLGARAWGEFVDVGLSGCEPTPKALLEGLNGVAPEGLVVTGVRRLREGDLGASKVITRLEYVVVLSEPRELLAARLDEARARQVLPIEVRRKGKTRELDLWSVVDRVELVDPSTLGLRDEPMRTALCFRQPFGTGATLKPHEVASAITGTEISTRQVLRLRCVALDETGADISPLRVGLVAAADIAEATHGQVDTLRKQAPPTPGDLAALVPDAPPRLLEIAGA